MLMKTTYLQYVFNLVAENYLLALCESDDRKAQISDVFKNTDVAEFTSTDEIFSNMFKLLGRLQLKSEAEKLLLDCYDGTIIMLFLIVYLQINFSFQRLETLQMSKYCSVFILMTYSYVVQKIIWRKFQTSLIFMHLAFQIQR